MPIVVPTLSTFAIADLDYITKMNADNAAIVTALNAVNADLTTQFDGTGILYKDDWIRPLSGADPINGVMGALSLAFVNDDGNAKFRLDAHPSSGTSISVIQGTRSMHTGNLEGDLTVLALADNTYTMFAGVDFLSPNGMTVAFSETEGDLGISLYNFQLVVSSSGTVYVIDRIKRTSRSMLWDNSLEQLRQEQKDTILVAIGSETGSANQDWYVTVPYDCIVDEVFINGAITGTTNTLRLRSQDGTTEYASGTISSSGYTTGDGVDVAMATAFIDVTFDADKIFQIRYERVNAFTDCVVGIRFRRSFNVIGIT